MAEKVKIYIFEKHFQMSYILISTVNVKTWPKDKLYDILFIHNVEIILIENSKNVLNTFVYEVRHC